MSGIPLAMKLGGEEENEGAITRRSAKRQKASVDTFNSCASGYVSRTARKESDGYEAEAASFSGPTDYELREVTLTMVGERSLGKTC
mmetsp:Transcript_16294/g.23975  ORF Transcript_16294/g.23975 Transcript_16294/m.23975 type:complete len:87 (+) Transcript_16294:239-499(+)|eukprot:CAMPEP_0194208422 /NCGR_PEP_ID=MMETSP0156-20130528/6878_1 /TAXON_ID=33649 /ORGANISM="Thalassionema nitzschioides, Strain L26-B" /LENGTH=86 /DNA_ID=CAMNT_0038935383 /DNA_START=197 /DNA_END=457 /DNA_ORIENTATION=-